MKYLLVAVLALGISPALAQEAEEAPAPAQAIVLPATLPAEAAPAAETTAPADAAPAAAPVNIPVNLQPEAGDFPPLPPSRPCARPDTDGVWKLRDVFENPRSSMSADFASYPHQYILFQRNDTFSTYRDIWGEKSEIEVRIALETSAATVLQQFIVHQSGIIFFYRNGEYLDSQACFIVANSLGPYKAGQMILMPPEGTTSVRLAMAYDRVDKRSSSASEAHPNPTIEDKKPRRKKRREVR